MARPTEGSVYLANEGANMGTRMPLPDALLGALASVRDDARMYRADLGTNDLGESNGIDVRLQVYDNGAWAIRTGDSSYDLDHRGFWGASTVGPDDSDETLAETARDLVEQAADSAAQSDELDE